MHYYIVGTEHRLQEKDAGLKAKLESVIRANNVVLIAEEVNANLPDAKRKSMGRELASTTIPWQSVDMTFQQQRDAGIYEALEHAYELLERSNINAYPVYAQGVRENYWLNCIETKCSELQITDGTVLITCGRNHLHFLADRARTRGFAAKIDAVEYPIGLGERLGKLEILD